MRKMLKNLRIIRYALPLLCLTVFVSPVCAQLMSLHKLSENELSYGFGYVYNNRPFYKDCNRVHRGIFSLDWGYTDNMKISFMPSLGWANDALSPGMKIRFMHIGETRDAYIGYFFRSDWELVGAECYDDYVLDMGTTTSVSVFFRIGNNPVWEIRPFIGFLHSSHNYEEFDADYDITSGYSSKGEVGLEIDFEHISILGSWQFVVNNTYPVVHVGLNLHYE